MPPFRLQEGGDFNNPHIHIHTYRFAAQYHRISAKPSISVTHWPWIRL